MFRSAAVLFASGAAVLFASGTAVAQDGSGVAINQTNTDRPGLADATGATQVGAPAAPLPQAAPTPRDRAVSGSGPSASAPVPYTQVTGERGQAYSGLDLRPVEPSAEAPASPARRADGRNTATVVPTGPDRCDPRRRPLPVACDRVIEARAGEFESPDHQPLSAEQRLLANQRELRPMSSDLTMATRRLANGDLDDSNIALAVASIALQGPGDVPAEEEDLAAEPSAIDAIVAGITTMVTGVQPNP